MPTARALLKEGTARLREAGIASAPLDARLLLQVVLGESHEGLLRKSDQLLKKTQAQAYAAAIARRAAGEPVACITGRKEFWSMEFATGRHTLDPRPETETLVEAVLCHPEAQPKDLKSWIAVGDPSAALQDDMSILDLGTGTGCLLLALLSVFPQARGTGADISPEALEVARGNAARLGFAERAEFILSDWGQNITGNYDLIVSNPPYIPTAEIAGLAKEVREYDPHLALDGGADGLECYRKIIASIIHHPSSILRPGGVLILEIGQGQEADASALLEAQGFTVKEQRKDLAGIVRCVVAVQLSS